MTAHTYKRLYGPTQLPNTATTLYTCPASTRAVIRHIHASNPGGVDRSVTLSIGADAAATRIWDAETVPADDFFEARRFTNYVLEAGEVLQGFASAATSVVLVVNGYEEPA